MIEKLQKLIPYSRKLRAFYIAMAVLFLLAFFGKITGEPVVWGIVGIFSAFMGGNVGEHWTKKGQPTEISK